MKPSEKLDEEVENPEKDKDSSSKKKDDIENWADQPESDVYDQCTKFYPTIQRAYTNRDEADGAIAEYWNIYHGEPDDNQIYQGNSKCYIPAVRDSIRARSKRALKQNFPTKYKHIDAVGTDDLRPTPQLALLEHYIRTTKLKSICRSVYIAGDVTGQWNLYVDWMHEVRNISGMIRRNPVADTLDGEIEDVASEDKEESLENEEVVDQGPTVTDFATEDMVVIPPTCNDIEKADLVSLKLRLSKHQVKKMVDDGVFILNDESDISAWIDSRKTKEKRNPPKKQTQEAGIKTEGTLKYCLIYEVTARLEFEKGKKELAYIYYAGENEIVGIIKAPQWGQKRPIISAPVDRLSGSFNGISVVEAVKWMQWNLNDFYNMGQDSAMYSMLPIIMSDPEKNPNWAMMVVGLAAVWPVDPNSTKFASFPPLWKDSMGMCQSIEQRIQQALDVNPMMMGQMPAGRKNANTMGAQQQESSIPILDHAERFEEEMLNPLMERFFEYDCQFRDSELTILTMGQIGIKAQMQVIPPNEWGNRYFFQWCGTEYVQNMQRMQQQIATMNVLRGIPPQQLNGRKLDIGPILEILTDNVFGSEMSGRILIDDRIKYSVPPDIEDEMMLNGIMSPVHEIDDDVEHLKKHHEDAESTGDPTSLIRNHMNMHMQQLMKKRQESMQAQQPHGVPGVPGGAGPGVAGSPRPGAQPQQPRPGQNPPGSIPQDSMPGATPRG